MTEQKAYLVLSTGDVLQGKWLGSMRIAEGEMVFNTAMTGYQEVMTDPSYAGQIVTLTYPLIGNYGFNDIDDESLVPSLTGLIISYPCQSPEHYQSFRSLEGTVTKYEIPTLYDIDTRALTRIIREHGEVYGKITLEPNDTPQKHYVAPTVVEQVSVPSITHTTENKNHSHAAPHVAIIDFGYKHSIKHTLVELGCNVTVVPFNTTLQTIDRLDADGIILSNGPGNPEDLDYLSENTKKVAEKYPTFGICLGHQLVAMAYGAKTKRLPYGHRGSNHPVKDVDTGKVFITSQNHGYVVDQSTVGKGAWLVSHYNINDQSVEGLVHRTKPIMTVQFHPEAHPGPVDTYHMFKQFVQQFVSKGEKQHA